MLHQNAIKCTSDSNQNLSNREFEGTFIVIPQISHLYKITRTNAHTHSHSGTDFTFIEIDKNKTQKLNALFG